MSTELFGDEGDRLDTVIISEMEPSQNRKVALKYNNKSY